MIYFIGIGPGGVDLLCIKSMAILKICDVCIYTGSIINFSSIKYCKKTFFIKDTSKSSLDNIIYLIYYYNKLNKLIARIHSGDPFLYSSINEQIFYLSILSIKYIIIPGITAISCAFSYVGFEYLSLQNNIILTKLKKKSLKNYNKNNIQIIGYLKSTLIIYLSTKLMNYIYKSLIYYYGINCPIILIYRTSWLDEICILSCFFNILKDIKKLKIVRSAIIIVNRLLFNNKIIKSKLYFNLN